MLPAITVVLLLALTYLVTRADGARPQHSPGYLLAVKLNRGLAGTPMRGTGYALVVEGRRYGIHPALIAGIAGTESSYGAAACSGNPYNAFGLASCGSGWYVPRFRSWRDAYGFTARFLREHWPTARTPWDLRGYAACLSCWASHVAAHMARLGFPAVTRYPA